MRFRLFVAVVLLFSIAVIHLRGAPQEAPSVLTNSDVVQMVKSGLSIELVIAKIKASKSNFDTSPSTLAELKTNGISESILLAMIGASSFGQVIPPTEATEPTLESARSSLKSLRRLASATEVGISYVNYSPLLAEVKTDVEDTLSGVKEGNLKAAIQAALNEYQFAGYVWQTTWRDDLVNGQLKDVAVKKYGVQKRGLLKVVWRTDFLNAIWREARNHFEVANSILTQARTVTSAITIVSDDLLGAWRIVLRGGGQTMEFNLTIIRSGDGYRGSIRSPMGNADNVQIAKSGRYFTLYTSQLEKKRTLSIQLDGTIEPDLIKGNATLSDGKQTGLLVFVATRLAS